MKTIKYLFALLVVGMMMSCVEEFEVPQEEVDVVEQIPQAVEEITSGKSTKPLNFLDSYKEDPLPAITEEGHPLKPMTLREAFEIWRDFNQQRSKWADQIFALEERGDISGEYYASKNLYGAHVTDYKDLIRLIIKRMKNRDGNLRYDLYLHDNEEPLIKGINYSLHGHFIGWKQVSESQKDGDMSIQFLTEKYRDLIQKGYINGTEANLIDILIDSLPSQKKIVRSYYRISGRMTLKDPFDYGLSYDDTNISPYVIKKKSVISEEGTVFEYVHNYSGDIYCGDFLWIR